MGEAGKRNKGHPTKSDLQKIANDGIIQLSSSVWQTDSMLPCVCLVMHYRWRQNVLRTKRDALDTAEFV